MKGKILLLGFGYLLGNIVSSVFSADKNSKFQKELKEARAAGLNTNKMILNHMTETHKNMFNELNDTYNTEENRAYMAEQAENLKAVMKDYKIEWEKLLAEIKENPDAKYDVVAGKMKTLYESKKAQLDELSSQAPHHAKKMKKGLLARYESFKNDMK